MTEIRCRCGGKISFRELTDVPSPPAALLAVGGEPPDKWRGWVWVCDDCGENVGVTYDYGTLDLGLVRDEQLSEGDFEVFA